MTAKATTMLRPDAGTVWSFLQIVSVSSVKKSLPRVIERNFGAAPLRPSASAQTVAGLVAAKKAVSVLARTVYGVRVRARDVDVAHTPAGAPYVAHLPGIVRRKISPLRKIHISISHTATQAFGLAAVYGRR